MIPPIENEPVIYDENELRSIGESVQFRTLLEN